MASLAFDNPLDAALSADDDDAEAEAGQPRGWQPDSNIKFYDQHPRRNNVAWLLKREKKQKQRVEALKLSYMQNFETGEMIDLDPDGETYTSWAFVFEMPDEDGLHGHQKKEQAKDAAVEAKMAAAEAKARAAVEEVEAMEGVEDEGQLEGGGGSVDVKAQRLEKKRAKAAALAAKTEKPWEQPDHPIPFEAWQFCHMLWKYDFHIEHSFSTLGNQLHILVGIPYQVLVVEAAAIGIKMRLETTLGTTRFSDAMIPQFKVQPDNTVFTSAVKQGLCMIRMHRMANVYPDVLIGFTKKHPEQFRERVFEKVLNQKPIRALLLYEMFVSCGCYRPHAGEIFGPTVLRVAQAVLANEYLIVLPPIVNDEDETSDEVGDAEIVEAALDLEQIVTWVDVEKSLLVLELWDDKAGRDECFVGTMKTYLPLHYKEQRDNLTEVWGNYQLICQKTVIGQDPEYVSRLALNDPRNAPKLQMAWRYQPLDDIRDYFGEEVAIYFAWLQLYTEALKYPAILGVIVMVAQIAFFNFSVDDNLLVLPYTVFFAAWSIVFLCEWRRREEELKFLWGSEGYEANERPLPSFKGKFVVNEETGQEQYVYHEFGKRYLKLTISWIISLMFIFGTITCAVVATFLKTLGEGTPDDASLLQKNKWKIISATANLLIIQIFGVIYQAVAGKLTDWENHRTRSEMVDATISKNFLFQFVNNYFVLFYIAYMRPYAADMLDETFGVTSDPTLAGSGSITPDGKVKSALGELQFQLVIVFTGKTLGARFVEIAKPKAMMYLQETLILLSLKGRLKAVESLQNSIVSAIEDAGSGLVDTLIPDADDGKTVDTGMSQGQQEQYLARSIKSDSEEYLSRKGGDMSRESEAESIRLLNAKKKPEKVYDPDDEYGDGGPQLTYAISPRHSPRIDSTEEESPEPGTPEAAAEPEAESAEPEAESTESAAKKIKTKELRKQLREETADDNMVEDEILMMSFDTSFDEFNEMVIQYGYLALFAPAFSLAPLFAMINNIFEIRIDSTKFCTIFRRPQWRPCEDIGAWYGVLNTLGFAAVITNCTMIAFVGSQLVKVGSDEELGFKHRVDAQRLWAISVGLEHAIMLLRVFILKVEPEEPDWVQDSKDILNFRVSQWEYAVKLMRKKGLELDEIHRIIFTEKAESHKQET